MNSSDNSVIYVVVCLVLTIVGVLIYFFARRKPHQNSINYRGAGEREDSLLPTQPNQIIRGNQNYQTQSIQNIKSIRPDAQQKPTLTEQEKRVFSQVTGQKPKPTPPTSSQVGAAGKAKVASGVAGQAGQSGQAVATGKNNQAQQATQATKTVPAGQASQTNRSSQANQAKQTTPSTKVIGTTVNSNQMSQGGLTANSAQADQAVKKGQAGARTSQGGHVNSTGQFSQNGHVGSATQVNQAGQVAQGGRAMQASKTSSASTMHGANSPQGAGVTHLATQAKVVGQEPHVNQQAGANYVADATGNRARAGFEPTADHAERQLTSQRNAARANAPTVAQGVIPVGNPSGTASLNQMQMSGANQQHGNATLKATEATQGNSSSSTTVATPASANKASAKILLNTKAQREAQVAPHDRTTHAAPEMTTAPATKVIGASGVDTTAGAAVSSPSSFAAPATTKVVGTSDVTDNSPVHGVHNGAVTSASMIGATSAKDARSSGNHVAGNPASNTSGASANSNDQLQLLQEVINSLPAEQRRQLIQQQLLQVLSGNPGLLADLVGNQPISSVATAAVASAKSAVATTSSALSASLASSQSVTVNAAVNPVVASQSNSPVSQGNSNASHGKSVVAQDRSNGAINSATTGDRNHDELYQIDSKVANYLDSDPAIQRINAILGTYDIDDYLILRLDHRKGLPIANTLIFKLLTNKMATLRFLRDGNYGCYRLDTTPKPDSHEAARPLIYLYLGRGEFTPENLNQEINHLYLYVPRRVLLADFTADLQTLMNRVITMCDQLDCDVTFNGVDLELKKINLHVLLRQRLQAIVNERIATRSK